MIKVAAIGTVTMIVWIDMSADLDSAESELAHAAFQFLRGKIDILQRNCAEAGKLFRIELADGEQSREDVERQLRQMCERLLANTVIENFSYTLEG